MMFERPRQEAELSIDMHKRAGITRYSIASALAHAAGEGLFRETGETTSPP